MISAYLDHSFPKLLVWLCSVLYVLKNSEQQSPEYFFNLFLINFLNALFTAALSVLPDRILPQAFLNQTLIAQFTVVTATAQTQILHLCLEEKATSDLNYVHLCFCA